MNVEKVEVSSFDLKKSAKIWCSPNVVIGFPQRGIFAQHLENRVLIPSKYAHVQVEPRKYRAVTLMPNIGYLNTYPYIVDKHDVTSIFDGLVKRILGTQNEPDPDILRQFTLCLRETVRQNIEPFMFDEVLSFFEYIARHRGYNGERKLDLILAYLKIPDEYDLDVEAHIKDEFYPKMKPPRWICARKDPSKSTLGPVVTVLEHKVYHMKGPVSFFKIIPFEDRFDYLYMRYGPYEVLVCTDFTSFEASFGRRFMTACEMELYEHMLRGHPEALAVLRSICKINTLKNKYFRARVEATRMSGEMVTSLGNGFSNAMILHFICKRKQCDLICADVEGDDCISAFKTGSTLPEEEDYAQLGFRIKIERHTRFSEASFCGNVLHYESRTLITSPQDFLRQINVSFNPSAFTLNERHCNSLLYAKCISYMVQYRGCPVIAPICRQILLRIGSNYDEEKARKEFARDYYVSQILDVPFNVNVLHYYREPCDGARCLMEKVFGMSMQEQYFHEENYMKGGCNPYDSTTMEAYAYEGDSKCVYQTMTNVLDVSQ